MKTLRALEEQATYIGELSSRLYTLGLEVDGLITENKNYVELIKCLILRSPPHVLTSIIHYYVKNDIEKMAELSDDAVRQAIQEIECIVKGVKNDSDSG